STTPIEISDVHTVSLTPFSATIEWRPGEPVSSRMAYGLNAPTLWTAPSDSVDHTATVTGLSFSTSYQLWVNANATDGRTATLPYMLTTPPMDATPAVSTGGGAILLDGQVTFPSVVMAACQESYASLIADGVDFFMDDHCANKPSEVSMLA